jgi:hypothetical protein
MQSGNIPGWEEDTPVMKSILVVMLFGSMGTAQTANSPAGSPLRSIQNIYVDKMPDGLDRYIRAEITKQFNGKLHVVPRPEDADAIMVSVEEHKTEAAPNSTDRRLELHDMSTGSISLLEKTGKVVLWASEVHDRGIWWAATKHGGPQKVAERVIQSLRKAMEYQSDHK